MPLIAFALVVTLTTALCLAPEVEAQDAGPVIVIQTADNPSRYHDPTIGNAVADMLIRSLSRTGRFTIVDARQGHGGSATLYLSARVTAFSYQERAIAGSTESAGPRYEQSSTVRIDVTAVNSLDQVAFTESVEHDEVTTSRTTMMGGYEYLLSSSVSMHDMSNSMMGRATEMAVDRAVNRVTRYLEVLSAPALAADTVEGQVVAIVDAKSGVIDKGRLAGIREGDELEILRGQPIADDTGSVVFTRSVSVGMATVSESQDDGALIVATTPAGIRAGDFFSRSLPSASEHIDRGTAFLNAAFFHAAAREYRAARAVDPQSLEVHYHLGLAYMKTGNAEAAFESFSRFLDAGAVLKLAVTHQHIFSNCTGTLELTRDSVAYRPPGESRRDHWFHVPLAEVVEQRIRVDGDLVLRVAGTAQAERDEHETSREGRHGHEARNWAFRLHLMDEHDQLADIIVKYLGSRHH